MSNPDSSPPFSSEAQRPEPSEEFTEPLAGSAPAATNISALSLPSRTQLPSVLGPEAAVIDLAYANDTTGVSRSRSLTHISSNSRQGSTPTEVQDAGQPDPIQPISQRETLSQPDSQRQSLQQAAPPALKKWKPWEVRWYSLCFLLATTISLIVVICTLEYISQQRSGFIHLGDPPAFLTANPAVEKALWTQGILYTTLPNFFMTVYALMIESSVTSFMDIQPYIDLAKPGGSSAETTIMLDYRAYPVLYNWVIAIFWKKHWLLGIYMLMSFVLTIGVSPLTAFLFTDASVQVNSTLYFSFVTAFVETSISTLPDIRLMMDFASAFRVYDASPPPWTDGQYAFPKIVPMRSILNANLSVETTAYAAYVACRIIPETEYNLSTVKQVDVNVPGVIVQISADDRGCSISKNFIIQGKTNFPGMETTTTIMQSWETATCAFSAGWSRLSIISGVFKQTPDSLTNFSLISCIPSYWIISGTLAMSMSSSTGLPLIQAFSENKDTAQAFRPPALAPFFEKALHQIGSFNLNFDLDANDFGRQVYALALKGNSASPLLPEVVSNAVQISFTSIYAVLCATVVFQPILNGQNNTGVSTTTETRLIVVSPIAYVIVAILFAIAVAIVTMFWYVRKLSLLVEEPRGLLGHAAILQGSNIPHLLEEVRNAPGRDDGRIMHRLEEMRILEDATCRMEPSYPSGYRIVVENLPPTSLHPVVGT